jgi:alpha-mannosidase
VDPNAPTALNDYFYLPGIDLKKLQRSGAAKVSVKEGGPLLAALLVESEAPGCQKLTREIRVVEGLDRVEIINTLDKQAVRAKEGVHIGFGLNVPECTVRMDVPWAVVRAETDQIPGACKNWFTVQRWMDISNPRFGITLATPDAPLFEIGAITANLVGSLSDPKAWRDHVDQSGTVYAWVMNNHWHTNYRAEQDGPTVFRFLLWPHKAFVPELAAQFGAGCSQPLIPVPAGGARSLGSMLSVEPAGVLVTAFKPSEDGKAVIVRLFGASGKDSSVRLKWRGPVPKAVYFSDLAERAIQRSGTSIAVPAFGLVTLRAEL